MRVREKACLGLTFVNPIGLTRLDWRGDENGNATFFNPNGFVISLIYLGVGEGAGR